MRDRCLSARNRETRVVAGARPAETVRVQARDVGDDARGFAQQSALQGGIRHAGARADQPADSIQHLRLIDRPHRVWLHRIAYSRTNRGDNMKRNSKLTIAIATATLVALGGTAVYAQDKYSLKSPGGIA